LEIYLTAVANGFEDSGRLLRTGDLLAVDSQNQISAAKTYLRNDASRAESGNSEPRLTVKEPTGRNLNFVQNLFGIRECCAGGFVMNRVTALS
jgi:hypothetical protein